jgi:hypothetical protein
VTAPRSATATSPSVVATASGGPRQELDRDDLGARGVEVGHEHRQIVAAEARHAIAAPAPRP